MDKKILRKLQMTQLEILKDVKKLCDKYDITYILSGGTLLGAVRHKGFIPWDDDLDISMTRSEYERFNKIAPMELEGSYFVQNWYTDTKYAMPYTKILKNNTKLQEAVTLGSDVHNGIFIDVLPIDNCAKREKMKYAIIPYIYWTKLLLMKSGYKVWRATGAQNKIWKYIPFIIASKFIKRNLIIKKIEKITRCWNQCYKSTGLCFESVGYSFLPWIVRKNSIFSTTELLFEDDIFRVPLNYEQYLTDLFGDYMTFPPESERENRHNILAVKF